MSCSSCSDKVLMLLRGRIDKNKTFIPINQIDNEFWKVTIDNKFQRFRSNMLDIFFFHSFGFITGFRFTKEFMNGFRSFGFMNGSAK